MNIIETRKISLCVRVQLSESWGISLFYSLAAGCFYQILLSGHSTSILHVVISMLWGLPSPVLLSVERQLPLALRESLLHLIPAVSRPLCCPLEALEYLRGHLVALMPCFQPLAAPDLHQRTHICYGWYLSGLLPCSSLLCTIPLSVMKAYRKIL